MAKQTFTTGQVLTAAQMTSLQQTAMGGGDTTAKTTSYTLVAADAGTTVAMNSASATTITVNTGLFAAGDTVFIQNRGAGVCTVTAGTATVACAGSLALPQNDAGILYFTSASAAIFYDWIQVGATSPLTTKGDLYGYSTSDARIPIGTNGHVLTADSTESLGLKWAAPAGGSMTLLATLSLTTGSTVSSGTISNSYLYYRIYVEGCRIDSGLEFINLRLNGDTGNNYSWTAWDQNNTASVSGATNDAQSSYRFARTGNTNVGTRNLSGVITIQNPSNTSRIYIESKATGFDGPNYYPHNSWGLYGGSAAITSVSLTTAGTFHTGNAYIYGVN